MCEHTGSFTNAITTYVHVRNLTWGEEFLERTRTQQLRKLKAQKWVKEFLERTRTQQLRKLKSQKLKEANLDLTTMLKTEGRQLGLDYYCRWPPFPKTWRAPRKKTKFLNFEYLSKKRKEKDFCYAPYGLF